jgi:hypothetical protein
MFGMINSVPVVSSPGSQLEENKSDADFRDLSNDLSDELEDYQDFPDCPITDSVS